MKLRLMMMAALAAGLTLGSCSKKDDPKPNPDPISQNPGTAPNPDSPAAAAMAAKVNGTSWQATQTSLVLQNGQFTLLGTGANETVVTLSANAVTQPGTYCQVQGTSGSFIEGHGDTGKTWSSVMGGTATLIITKLDLQANKASGTFSINASPVANAAGVKNITEGIFTDISIE